MLEILSPSGVLETQSPPAIERSLSELSCWLYEGWGACLVRSLFLNQYSGRRDVVFLDYVPKRPQLTCCHCESFEDNIQT